MTEAEYTTKLEEVDRLLNDPNIAIQPVRVWSLMAELSRHMAAADECSDPGVA
jgi:hypothetical protein